MWNTGEYVAGRKNRMNVKEETKEWGGQPLRTVDKEKGKR
jgi:hypothetical protein